MKECTILSILLLSGCVSPYKLAKLEPLESKTYWSWGRHYAIETAENIEVRIAYENNTRSQVVFNIEIENFGNDTVLVAPELFFSEYFSDSINLDSRKVIDPEYLITKLEKDRAQQQADQSNAAASQLFESSLNLASDIASIGTEQTEEERYAEQQQREATWARHDREDYELKMQQMSLDDRRRFYDETLLRKTSLPPHSFMSGQSYFWLDKKAKRYRLQIPIGPDILSFDFSQRILLD